MSTEVKAQNTISMTSVKAIKDASDEANALLDGMRQSAEDAGTTLNGIYADAERAKESAESATQSADVAQRQLSVVENIVGVLDLIAKNGDYQATADEEVVPNKWYFDRISGSGTTADPYVYQEVSNITSVYHLTADVAIDSGKTYYTRTGTGTEADPYVYTVVASPVVADIGTYYEKYYELVGIDSAIQNYVSSHLVLTNEGLSLQTDGSNYRLDLTTTGMNIIGSGGQTLASYGTDTTIGDVNGFHVKIDSTELGFYQGAQRVAYINGNKLYITQSVVLQQMDVGKMVADGGKGQWSWKVHEVNNANNLYLKWLG